MRIETVEKINIAKSRKINGRRLIAIHIRHGATSGDISTIHFIFICLFSIRYLLLHRYGNWLKMYRFGRASRGKFVLFARIKNISNEAKSPKQRAISIPAFIYKEKKKRFLCVNARVQRANSMEFTIFR